MSDRGGMGPAAASEDGADRCRECGASLESGTGGCAACSGPGDTLAQPVVATTPEIVISAAEVEALGVGPTVQRVPPIEVRLAPVAPPRRVSRLALASLVPTLASATILLPVALGLWVLGGALVAAVLAVALGTSALVVIASRRTVRGALPALVAVVGGSAALVVGVLRMDVLAASGLSPLGSGIELEDLRPPADEIDHLPSPQRTALRANVLIRRTTRRLLATEEVWGSGVVTRVSSGAVFILSNRHVVGNREGVVEVHFCDGSHRPATVEWVAPDDVDLAVVATAREGVAAVASPPIRTALLERGSRVFAVGNPLNLSWSYTEGVISGLRGRAHGKRSITIYQTQTPINYGNSGGGLYSMAGELVGINTWTGAKAISEGLGFAIAAGTILECFDSGERARFLDLEPRGQEAP